MKGEGRVGTCLLRDHIRKEGGRGGEGRGVSG